MRVGPAGELDRRIMIQLSTPKLDPSGDQIQSWDDDFKLWARRVPKAVGLEKTTEGGLLREYDIVFEVRDGGKARSIAPESNRLIYKRRVYEIVGVRPSAHRADRIEILAATRPDQRGSRAPEGASGEP